MQHAKIRVLAAATAAALSLVIGIAPASAGPGGTNRGGAVSTAASCQVTGRARGMLVSSTARNSEATVESASAECAAALAAQGGTGGGA